MVRTLRLLVLHDVVGDGRADVARVPIGRRRGPGQQDRPAALLRHVQIAWEVGWLLHEQVDHRLVTAVRIRGDADVVAAVHVVRLHDPQLGGDASRNVRRIVYRVPGPEIGAVTRLIDTRRSELRGPNFLRLKHEPAFKLN